LRWNSCSKTIQLSQAASSELAEHLLELICVVAALPSSRLIQAMTFSVNTCIREPGEDRVP
jgi:hypothetical protein